MNKVTKNIGVIAGTVSMLALINSPSNANVDHYATVKKWEIQSLDDGNNVTGCRLINTHHKEDELFIEYINGKWQMVFPTGISGTFIGGILSIDKADIDSQFGLNGDFAERDLSQSEIKRIRSGRFMSVELNGNTYSWGLNDASAALSKVEDCLAFYGLKAKPKPVATNNRTVANNSSNSSGNKPNERHYASVSGWNVLSQLVDGRFAGCIAQKRGQHQTNFGIGQSSEGIWAFGAQYNQTDNVDGFFSVDKYNAEKTYFVSDDWSITGITVRELELLKSGTTANLQIVGGGTDLSLKGSSAAIAKVSECTKRAGKVKKVAKKKQVVAKRAPTQSRQVAPPRSQQVAPPVSPQNEPLTGYNASFASFAQGAFRQRSDGSWVEEGNNGSRFFFTETSRDAENVYLDDTSRNIQIAINVSQGIIYFSQNYGNFQRLYDINRAD